MKALDDGLLLVAELAHFLLVIDVDDNLCIQLEKIARKATRTIPFLAGTVELSY